MCSSLVAFSLLHHLAMSGIKLFIVYTMTNRMSWMVQTFGNEIQRFLIWACRVRLRLDWC